MAEPALKSEFVTCADLMLLLKLKRPGDVRRALERQGIPFFESNDGPWTTQPLIELAGKVKLGLVKPEGKEPLL